MGFWDGYDGSASGGGKGVVAGKSTVSTKTGKQPSQHDVNPSFYGSLDNEVASNLEEEANKRAASNSKKNKENRSFFGNAGTASQVLGHVGDFIGSAVKGVVDSATGSYNGINDVLSGQDAANNTDRLAEKEKSILQASNAFQAKLKQSDYDKPEIKAKLQDFNKQLDALKDPAKHEQDILSKSQNVNAKKTAADTAETFLNVATLGTGTAGKALAKEGAKQVGEAVIERGAKNVITKGGKTLTKKGITDVVERGVKGASEGAAFGAGTGAIDSIGNGSTDPQDILGGAAQGALGGALFGGVVGTAGGALGTVANNVKFNKAGKASAADAATIKAPDPNINKPQIDSIDENLARLDLNDERYLKDNNLTMKGKSDSLTLAESKLAEPERRALHEEAAAKIVNAETQLQKLNEFRTQSPYFRQLDRLDTAKQSDIDGLRKLAKEQGVDNATLKDALSRVESEYAPQYDELHAKFPDAKASLPQLDEMQKQLSVDRLAAHREAQRLQSEDQSILDQTDGMIDVADPDALQRYRTYLEAQKQALQNEVDDANVRATTPANNSLEANEKINDIKNPNLHPEHFDGDGRLTDDAAKQVQQTQIERATANLIDSNPHPDAQTVASSPGLQRKADLSTGETTGNATYDKIMASETVSDDAKKLITNISHKVQSTKKTEEYAQSLVEKDPDAARQLFDSEAFRTGDAGTHNILGKTLAEHYYSLNDTEAESAVYNKLISAKSDQARGLAMGNIDVVSPYGIIKHAERIASDKGKTLTEQMKSNLKESAKYIETLKNGPEKQAAMRNLLNVAEQRGVWDKIGDTFKSIASLPRTLMTTADLSFGLRQGAILGTRYPVIWAKAEGLSARWAVDPKFYEKSMQDILTATDKNSDALGPLYKRMGLSLEGAEGRSEETFGNTTILESKAAKHALIGHVVSGSDRAFSGSAAYLRANVAKKIINQYGGVAAVDKWDNKALADLGKVIDTATGRGSGGQWFERAAPTLGQTLFSARLWKSRLDTLNPVYYAKLSPAARKVALQSAGSFASVVTATLAAASASGASVESNPLSSDFGKIKVGETRYDIMGGLQQNIVLAARELTGKTMNANGDITDLGSENGSNDNPWFFNGNDRLGALSQTVTNKLAPVVATTATLLQGKDYQGNPIDPWKEVSKLFIPLGIQDAASTAEANDGDLSKAGVNSIPSFFGIGVNSYGPGALSETDQKAVDEADPADYDKYNAFYKQATTVTGRTARSNQITQLVRDGKIEQARRKAAEFNTMVDEKLQPFYDKYEHLDQDLRKELNDNLYITLTDKSIKQRAKSEQ